MAFAQERDSWTVFSPLPDAEGVLSGDSYLDKMNIPSLYVGYVYTKERSTLGAIRYLGGEYYHVGALCSFSHASCGKPRDWFGISQAPLLCCHLSIKQI